MPLRDTTRRALKRAGLAIVLALVGGFLVFHEFLAIVVGADHAVAEVEIAGRRVAIWKPAGAAPPDGYPVILFSHGFTGCGTQSVFLTEGLAQAGFFVLAPNHLDAGCDTGSGKQGKLFSKLLDATSMAPFRQPEVWTDDTYRDRRDDLEAVLDAILKEKSFQGVPIDSGRIGLAGHSLGGYTVLALAGAWPSWRDRRVKAVLALSPYCTPFILKGSLGDVDVPVMFQGGTRDFGITPSVRRPGGAYERTSAPKYFVGLAGAGHFDWTNLKASYQSVINEYALAFFDRYLSGTIEPDRLSHLLERPWPSKVNDLEYALK
jgi:predicted dienelactone hydrolase